MQLTSQVCSAVMNNMAWVQSRCPLWDTAGAPFMGILDGLWTHLNICWLLEIFYSFQWLLDHELLVLFSPQQCMCLNCVCLVSHAQNHHKGSSHIETLRLHSGLPDSILRLDMNPFSPTRKDQSQFKRESKVSVKQQSQSSAHYHHMFRLFGHRSTGMVNTSVFCAVHWCQVIAGF